MSLALRVLLFILGVVVAIIGIAALLSSPGNQASPEDAPRRRKVNYVGAPAVFALELACQHINEAFGDYGCYLVGSALERPDWRDIDVRFIMPDEAFAQLFPDTNVSPGTWLHHPRWLLLTTSISAWLKAQTGLPVDFQIQPQSHANDRHKGPRHALGMRIGKRPVEAHQA